MLEVCSNPYLEHDVMLQNVDNIPAYERMHLLTFKQDVENSHYLNNTQKECIERKLQEIVNVWMNPDFVKESQV